MMDAGEARFDGSNFPGVDPAHFDVRLLPDHQLLDQAGLVVVQRQPERRATLVQQVHAGGGFQLEDDLREFSVGGPRQFE